MPTAFVNARVLTPQGFVDGQTVLVEQGRIAAILDADAPLPAAAARRDLAGTRLVPGFIDCQVNGGGGVLFNDLPTLDTIRRIGKAHARYGTTGFLPTLISDDAAVMRTAIEAVDAAIAGGVPGVLGIHLEGPYLAPERRGIHNAAKFHRPTRSDLALASSLHHGRTLVTLAPDRVPADAIAALVKRGVVVAAGHTAADYATIEAALAAGLRGFTHLFNAMTPLQAREPGVVGAALEDPASWCGVIVDGHHVHPAALRIALAAKTRGKIYLVTDAMSEIGGALFGKQKLRVRGIGDVNRKSIGGTVAGFAGALVFCIWVVLSQGMPPAWIGLGVTIAIASTLLELFSPRGTDDFFMATGNALICLAFGMLFAH